MAYRKIPNLTISFKTIYVWFTSKSNWKPLAGGAFSDRTFFFEQNRTISRNSSYYATYGGQKENCARYFVQDCRSSRENVNIKKIIIYITPYCVYVSSF